MKNKLFFIVLFFAATLLVAQSSIEINLAKTEEKVTHTPFTFNTIVLKYRLIAQDMKYSCQVESIDKVIPPFQWSQKFSDSIKIKCKNLQSHADELVECIDETKLPPIIEQIKNEIKDFGDNYSGECKKDIELALRRIDSTTFKIVLPGPVELTTDHDLQITIKRDDKVWTVIYTTGTANPWSILYGFTYVPNWINHIDTYYAKPDLDNKYVITKSNNQRKDFLKNITPTMMFTWHPVKKSGNFLNDDFWQLGLTAGISLDLTNPTAMFGPTLLFGENVSLNTGIVFTQKDVLNGKYSAGQTITENLNFEQLHEKIYMAEFFISIGFRFDKNPFGSSSDKSKDDKKEENPDASSK